MNRKAVEKVLGELGWNQCVTEADVAFQVDGCRRILAGELSGDREIAQRIVAAADLDSGASSAPTPSAETLTTERPAAGRDDRAVVLGHDAAGEPVTLEAFGAGGMRWETICRLSPFGARCKEAFREIRMAPFRERAAQLGADVAAVEAAAQAAGMDPALALQGEADLLELVAKDRNRAGLSPLPASPPAPARAAGQQGFLARAAALKIDVLAVEARAKAAGQQLPDVLKAEIELQEIVLRQKAAEGR